MMETSQANSKSALLVLPTAKVEFNSVEDLTDLHQASTEGEELLFNNPIGLISNSKQTKLSVKFPALQRGKELISSGSFKRAELAVDQVLNGDPKLPKALLLRGVAKAGQGRHQEALIEFDKVLALGEDDAALRQSRGISLLALGRKKEAEAEFSRAIEHDSKFAQAYAKRGVLRGSMGKFEEAAADFSRFIDLRPNSPIGYKNRALALIKLDRRADAQPDIIRAKKLEKK